MNLHAVAVGVISAVNPQVSLSIQVSAGSVTVDDGTQIPVYRAAISRTGQVQPMSDKDLRQVEGLNLQGTLRAMYVNGKVDGVVRVDKKGGDLVTTPDGKVWLNAMTVEAWPDWCKFVVVLQNETAQPTNRL